MYYIVGCMRRGIVYGGGIIYGGWVLAMRESYLFIWIWPIGEEFLGGRVLSIWKLWGRGLFFEDRCVLFFVRRGIIYG